MLVWIDFVTPVLIQAIVISNYWAPEDPNWERQFAL